MHGFIVLKGSYGDLGCTTVDETKTAHLMESKSASVRDSKRKKFGKGERLIMFLKNIFKEINN